MEVPVDIIAQLNRAKELNKELENSCKSDLISRSISEKTKNLTQEILVKLRSSLDQAMYKFFEKKMLPRLNISPKNNKVYFPIVPKKSDLNASLGRSGIKDLNINYPKVFSFLESIQPDSEQYSWLGLLSKYANEKHIRLTPQKIIETKRRIVTNNSGSVSWGEGVTFGEGVSVMGAQMNPITQNIEPTEGIESRDEIWISFLIEDSNINSLALCNKSTNEVEKIINTFFSLF